MMAGNPNWWSMHPQSSSSQLSINNNSQQFVFYGSSNITAPSASASLVDNHHSNLNHDFPVRSWSQLLLGVEGEEDRYGANNLFQQQKKLENYWEDHQVHSSMLNPYSLTRQAVPIDHVGVKQEELVQPRTTCHHLYDDHNHDDQIIKQNTNIMKQASSGFNWPPQVRQNSALINGFLNFSGGIVDTKNQNQNQNQHQHQNNLDQSSECNSTSTAVAGVVSNKKARVQQSSSQPALKVRKEKLGDRITALHQLVSPFGKTDTASVLSEAIGYIRFLQSQIEALSTPYMRNAAASTSHHQHSEYQIQGDLRSRGLCLVPISCTQNVGNDTTAADYWAPTAFGGGF